MNDRRRGLVSRFKARTLVGALVTLALLALLLASTGASARDLPTPGQQLDLSSGSSWAVWAANTGASGAAHIFSLATAPVTYSSIRGTDRYDTAIKISQAMFPGALPAGSGLVLAPGRPSPRRCAARRLAAAYGGPVLLTPGRASTTPSGPRSYGWRPSTCSASGCPDTVVTLCRPRCRRPRSRPSRSPAAASTT